MLSQRENELLKQFQNLPRDFVANGAHHAYREFRDSLLAELAPSGILETLLADEIVSASWRLRRCSENEADLAFTVTEKSEFDNPSMGRISRARAAAAKLLFQAINELRRLQTERQLRAQTEPKQEKPGLARLHCAPKPPRLKTNPIGKIPPAPAKSRHSAARHGP